MRSGAASRAVKHRNPEDSPVGEWLAASMVVASFLTLMISSFLIH